jgi:hypothetical protein
METLTIIFSTVSFLLSMISMVIGIFAFIELRSFMKSTHKIEFLPLDAGISASKEPNVNEELRKYGLMD